MKKNISASEVKKLRETTGASVMECRKALLEENGDVEKAVRYIKRKGNEKALKKADRETAEGVIATYVHNNKKIGSMVELFCETDFVARNSQFQELAHDLAMHIAAMNPEYGSAEKVPQNHIEEYRKIVRKETNFENKPEEVVEKIISGKIKKHFDEISLMNQPFIREPRITVGDLIKEKISLIGENIQVGNFVRFSI